MDDEETQDVEATTSPHPSSAAPPTTTATPSTFGANLSEHSAFSGVSFYSVSVNSEQSEITAPQTNVTSLSRNVGTPSRISIDARSADDFNVVDSSVRESEKSLEVILEHGQRLPMREGDQDLSLEQTTVNPSPEFSWDPNTSVTSFAHDSDIPETPRRAFGNYSEISMTTSEVFLEAEPASTHRSSGETHPKSVNDSSNQDRGSSNEGYSQQGDSYDTYTDESTVEETPFFSPTNDLERPG